MALPDYFCSHINRAGPRHTTVSLPDGRAADLCMHCLRVYQRNLAFALDRIEQRDLPIDQEANSSYAG